MWLHHGKDYPVLYRHIVSVLMAISVRTDIGKNLHIGHRYDMYQYIGTPLVHCSSEIECILAVYVLVVSKVLLLQKQLVLPNMESIAIPVLKSAIPEDSVKLLTSPK